MVYSVRLSDIPAFIIFLVISIPLAAGFVELIKRKAIDIQNLPSWLFTILFLSYLMACLWISKAIWTRIRNALQR